MITSRFFAPLSVVALVAALPGPDASAQRIASPAGVSTPTLGGGSYRSGVQPQSLQGQVTPSRYGQTHYRPPFYRPSPPVRRPYPPVGRPVPFPGYNPIVDRDGFVDTEYDPFSNVIDVNRQRISKRLSAYDPHRGHVDSGSLRQVDRWVQANGQWVREHGTTWTSHGVPHGNLTRDRSTFTPFPGQGHHPGYGGGVRENDSDTVIYALPSGPQTSNGNGAGNSGVRHNDRDTVLYSTVPNPQPANAGGPGRNDRRGITFGVGRPR